MWNFGGPILFIGLERLQSTQFQWLFLVKGAHDFREDGPSKWLRTYPEKGCLEDIWWTLFWWSELFQKDINWTQTQKLNKNLFFQHNLGRLATGFPGEAGHVWHVYPTNADFVTTLYPSIHPTINKSINLSIKQIKQYINQFRWLPNQTIKPSTTLVLH